MRPFVRRACRRVPPATSASRARCDEPVSSCTSTRTPGSNFRRRPANGFGPRDRRPLAAVGVDGPADGDGLETELGVQTHDDVQRLARRVRPDGLREHPQRVRHRHADAALADVDRSEARRGIEHRQRGA